MRSELFSRRDLLRLSILASLAPVGTSFAAPSSTGSDKKGLAIAVKKKGWDEKLRKLNCKWFYSWGAKIPEGVPAGVDFKPMIWGYWGDKAGLAKTGQKIKEAGIKELLGFNEPDRKNQANMSVEKALRVWPLLMETGLRLGSPACVHPDDDWMKAFMAGVKKKGLRVDFVTVHSYGGPNANELEKRLRRIQKMYNKPLWITEFAVGDWNAKTPQTNKHKPEKVLKFMEAILPKLNKMDFIERYAWYNVGQNSTPLGTSALLGGKGKLTRLGECYRDA
ncbi:RNA polymerase [Oceaniferula spumae]|uniref:RNA polymerase n=1 Tax=Oceaniferula spumae TaxID=2979115 RepID=A0AAT9FM69_9BACT